MKKLQLSFILLFLLHPFIITVTRGQGVWNRKADVGGLARRGASGFAIGTKVYIGIGGNMTLDFWEWNQTTNVWTQKANFAGEVRNAAVSFSIGTKGYVGTGRRNSTYYNDFWEWDQATNLWTQKANFGGAGRYCAVGFSIGNKGYIGTGTGGVSGPYYNDFWEWDQATNSWTQKANFGGTERFGAVGFSIGTKGYVGTGFDNNNTQDFWEWNQATDVWTQKTNFPGSARVYATGFSIGTKGYLGTGYNYTLNPREFTDFWEWDQINDTWLQKTNLPGTGRATAVGVSLGNKGYIGTGGEVFTNVDYKDFFEFDANCFITAGYESTISCGSAVLLNASFTPTNNAVYNWSPSLGLSSSTIVNPTASPTSTITYTLTAQDATTQCKATAPFKITVLTPSVAITGATTLNCGGSTTLTATCSPNSGNLIYNWSSSTGLSSTSISNPIASPSVTTTYTLIVQDTITHCSVTKQITINVMPPSVVISGTATTICSSSKVYLSAMYAPVSSNITYSWTPAAGLSSTSISNPVASPSVTTTYTLTATNTVTNCSAAAKFTVNFVPLKINSLWAKQSVSSDNCMIQSIVADQSSNVYATGYFSAAVTFGNIILANAGDGDIFLVKYDVSGKVIWAKNFGGSFKDVSLDITMDGSGNIYLAGYFGSASITFGSIVLTKSSATHDGFLVKFDLNGNVVWAKKSAGTYPNQDINRSVATDANGNAYVVGHFSSDSIMLGGYTLKNTSTIGSDVFIAKYNSSGNVLWAISGRGANDDDGMDIATDMNGSLYVTGIFTSSTITFNNIILTKIDTTIGSPNAFLIKIDQNGNVLWGKRGGSTNGPAFANSVTAKSNGDVYITGTFNSTTPLIFDDDTLIDINNSGDMFLIKYDALGKILWAKRAGDNGASGNHLVAEVYARSITTDVNGNVYITGMYNRDITFDNITLTNSYHSPSFPVPIMFLAKYSPSGNALWATGTVPGIFNSNCGNSVVTDRCGYVYVAGRFDGTMNIVSDTLISTFQNSFLIKSSWAVFNMCTKNASCYGGNDGSADVTVIGGTPPYSYNWDNNQTSQTVTGLAAGNYTVTVTDSLGCIATTTVTIIQPNVISATVEVVNATSCTSTNGSASVSSTLGGTPPYSYLWYNGATTKSITGLSPGNYFVTIIDAYNCTISQLASVTSGFTAVPNIVHVMCHGGNNGSINLVANGSNNLIYSWSTGATSANISGLTAGTYTATITDTVCKDTLYEIINITQPAVLTLSLNVKNASSCSSNDGSIKATPLGGTSPYSYLWSNGKTSETITGLVQGTYTLTITDAYACAVTIVASITCPTSNNGQQQLLLFNSFAVHPNPTSGKFIIKTVGNRSHIENRIIEIYNILGEQVLSKRTQNEESEIDLSNQPNGMYFLQIKFENGSAVKKIIVSK